MSNVLELTDLLEKSKKIERRSGRVASKVRLTPATVFSFRKNIDTGLINRGIANYNNTYDELHNAVVSAEVAAAEQEARDKALNESSNKTAEQLRSESIAEDNLVARITSAEVAKPRLDAVKIVVEKLKGRFGRLKDNFGVYVKKGFYPRALSVPKLYSKSYSVILSNADLYKLAVDIGVVDSSVPQKVESANWKNLFDNIGKGSNREINVVIEGGSNTEEETFASIEIKGITNEEIEHRRLMGQLGDELQEIRRLQVSSNGLASPFNDGLITREDALLGMLSSLSGVESIATRKVAVTPRKDNTDFQNLIEQIVGYKDPVSEEEHKQQQDRLQAYYSDPEVLQTIEELRHKEMLYTFNQPEAYEKVMQAERKDNQKKADELSGSGLLNASATSNEKKEKKSPIVEKKKEETPSQTLDISVQPVGVRTDDDKEKLLEGAKEQAEMIHARNERESIIIGAEEQARLLQMDNERLEILEGAEEQAKMLSTLSYFMDKQEEMEKAQEEERQKLLQGAEEQARMLHASNEHLELISAAEEQARMLSDIPEEANLMEQLADQIVYQNTTEDHVVEGAEEQARMLFESNQHLELMDSAEEQAQMLHSQNIKIDLINGAEEQAQMLYQTSKAQTTSLFKSFGYEILDDYDRYGNIVSASKPLKLRQAQMNNIVNFPGRKGNSSKSVDKRQVLSSLRDQLDSEEFDFLTYQNDKVNVKVA